MQCCACDMPSTCAAVSSCLPEWQRLETRAAACEHTLAASGCSLSPPPPLTHSTCAVPLTQQLGYAGLTLIDAAGQEWALVYSTAAHSLALYPAASLEHCAEQHPGAPLS